MSNKKDHRRLIKQIKATPGYACTAQKSGHFKAQHLASGRSVTISASPSDYHALRNVIRDLETKLNWTPQLATELKLADRARRNEIHARYAATLVPKGDTREVTETIDTTPNGITKANGDDAFLPPARQDSTGQWDRIPFIPAVNQPAEQEVRVYQELITQEKAAHLIQFNYEMNRPIITSNVTKLANDMRDGHMVLNGDAIRFSDDGDLIDGQHRLTAAASVDNLKPFWTLLTTGHPKEAYKTIDTNATRNFGTLLQSNRVKNPLLQAAIVASILFWTKGQQWLSRGRDTNTVTELEELNNRFPDLFATVTAASARYKTENPKAPLTPSMFGTVLFISIMHRGEEKAKKYWEYHISQGHGLSTGHPADAFKKRMRAPHKAENGGHVALSRNEIVGFAFMSWIAYLNDEHVIKFQIPRNGWTKDHFMKMIKDAGIADIKF